MKKIIFGIIIFASVVVSSFFINDNNTTTIKAISYNGNNLRISIDGEISNTLPTSGTYYLVDYNCSNANTKITWDKINYTLDVSNGTKKGGVACYLEFKSKPLLSEMPVGSYVAYTGDSNNGCNDTNFINGYSSCSGKNAYYESDISMGFCYSSNYKFHVNGWRIGYVEDGSAYLVSAGAPECMCTNSDGTLSSNGCSTSLSATNINKHYDNMDAIALKYCNSKYAKGGICNSNTAWAMKAIDFENITGSVLSTSSCYLKNSNFLCGWINDLIDNGSYYWFATKSSSSYSFNWSPNLRSVNGNSSNLVYGVRPILNLESSVIVTGGNGTYLDPYVVDHNYFTINDNLKYINATDDLSSVVLSMNTIEDDVASMCISVDTSVCSNYINYSTTYTLNWSNENDGEKVVYVYYKNSAGEIVAAMNKTVIIDTIAPTTNSVSIDFDDGIYGTVTLASEDADYMCLSNLSNSSDDCTNWIDYKTSYVWSFGEGIGSKNVYAFFKDEAGNVANAVSDSMTCTNNCYKIFMDAYDNSYIYMMRSDGATALTTTSATNITWHTEGSQSMNVCGAYNYSNSAYIWCIGNNNKAYYKTSYSATSWNEVDISSYIDTSNYTYSIYPYRIDYAYIVRNDGKTNRISTSGLTNTSWSYGYTTDMATCSGYSSNRVICLGENGNYYYRTSYSATTSYINRDFIKLTDRTNDNSWVDMYYNNYSHIIESDGTNLYNARFSFSASSYPTWYISAIPGNGIRTCTSSGGNNVYNNYCLGYDGYLYYKTDSATSWTKTSVNVG